MIDVESVEKEIIRLATKYPDTTYNPPDGSKVCKYTEGETESGVGCLFGQAFQNLGVPREVLEHLDSHPLGGIGEAGELLGLAVPRRWVDVQVAQDAAWFWGDAIKELGADIIEQRTAS